MISNELTAAVVVWWGLGLVAGQFPGQPTGGEMYGIVIW